MIVLWFFLLFIYFWKYQEQTIFLFFYKEKMNLKLFFPFYYYLFLERNEFILFYFLFFIFFLRMNLYKTLPRLALIYIDRISGWKSIYICLNNMYISVCCISLALSSISEVYAMVVNLSLFIFKEILSPNPTSAP